MSTRDPGHWDTNDEVAHLRAIAGGRGQNRATRLDPARAIRGYIKGWHLRSNWGLVDPKVALAEAETLLVKLNASAIE